MTTSLPQNVRDRIQGRLSALVEKAGDRLVTAEELARSLNVAERTVYRDIARLKRAGARVRSSAGVGYLIESNGAA